MQIENSFKPACSGISLAFFPSAAVVRCSCVRLCRVVCLFVCVFVPLLLCLVPSESERPRSERRRRAAAADAPCLTSERASAAHRKRQAREPTVTRHARQETRDDEQRRRRTRRRGTLRCDAHQPSADLFRFALQTRLHSSHTRADPLYPPSLLLCLVPFVSMSSPPPLPPYTPPAASPDDDEIDEFLKPEVGPDGLPLPVSPRDVYDRMQLRLLDEMPIYPILYPIGPDGDIAEGFLGKYTTHWTKDIGTAYLSGMAGGAMVGVGKGMVQSRRNGFTGWLRVNQLLNHASRIGGNTANTFGVFAFTYTMVKSASHLLSMRLGPHNDAYGAAAAATMQGVSRFGLLPGMACGVIVGCTTHEIMRNMYPVKRAVVKTIFG